MSAQRAAAALLEHDVQLAYLARQRPDFYSSVWGNLVNESLQEYVAGTWTLTLAAASAGATEEQVLAALFQQLGTGSSAVCRSKAKALMALA